MTSFYHSLYLLGKLVISGTTKSHHNCVKDRLEDFGMQTRSVTSVIVILDNHNELSLFNEGGGNYGGHGMIE